MVKRKKKKTAEVKIPAWDKSLSFAHGVRDGKIVVSEFARLAVERQLNDLENGVEGFFFSEEAANRPGRFIELLPHIKGEKANNKENIVLEPWQAFIISSVFGWINDKGHRRFKKVYIELPRKNGKSTLTCGVALYMLIADGEEGAEVYSAARNKDQAKIVFDMAKTMVDKRPGLKKATGVQTYKYAVSVANTSSVFRALSSDTNGNLDGLNVHFACVDEVHAHKDRGTWDALATATSARRKPLLWAITTAGSNREGICYELHTYAIKILKGEVKDDSFFAIIYCADKDDDYFSEDTWRKCNPNYHLFADNDLRDKARAAQEMPSAMANFFTKHLNVWVNSHSPWMNMVAWDECEDKTLNEDDFLRDECVIALDLATRTDILAIIKLYRREIDGVNHYYFFPLFYLPEKTVDTSNNGSYLGWVHEEYLYTTPGAATDLQFVQDISLELAARRRNLLGLVFDPWQAQQMIANITNQGYEAAVHGTSARYMSAPMKELEALVLSGRLHHDGNPIMTWMMGNVVCKYDIRENITPVKEAGHLKIDGPVALIMALGYIMEKSEDNAAFERALTDPIIYNG